jgi:hypothetical protein
MSNLFKRAAFALALVLGLMLGGAVSAQMGGKEEPKKEEKKDEKKPEAKKVDMPWTLDQVKKAIKKGQSAKYKLTSKAGDKEETGYMLEEVTDVTDKGYKTKTTMMDAEGKAKGDATESEKEWEKIFEGMEFTDKDTTIKDEKIKVTAGEYDCKVYTHTKEEEGSKSTSVIWFIKDKPGHIAKFTMEGAYGDFKYTSTMELVEVK